MHQVRLVAPRPDLNAAINIAMRAPMAGLCHAATGPDA